MLLVFCLWSCACISASATPRPWSLYRTVLEFEDGDISTLMGQSALVKGDREWLGSCSSSVWEGRGCIHNQAVAGALVCPREGVRLWGVPLYV